jgi:hypothetical protein
VIQNILTPCLDPTNSKKIPSETLRLSWLFRYFRNNLKIVQWFKIAWPPDQIQPVSTKVNSQKFPAETLRWSWLFGYFRNNLQIVQWLKIAWPPDQIQTVSTKVSSHVGWTYSILQYFIFDLSFWTFQTLVMIFMTFRGIPNSFLHS